MRSRRAALIVVACLATSACADSCGNREVARIRSPDEALDAVVFVRDCGATTDYSTQVSIVARDAQVDGAGNALVADGDHGTVASREGALPISVAWRSARVLSIATPPGARVFQRAQSAAGVELTYAEMAPAFR